MKSLTSVLIRPIGFIVLLIGAAGLAFVACAVASQGFEFFRTPGSLALVFAFSLLLLVACSGLALSFRGPAAFQRSLVPRSALVISGTAMLIAGVGFGIFGHPRTPQGAIAPSAIGAYLLWRGLRHAG